MPPDPPGRFRSSVLIPSVVLSVSAPVRTWSSRHDSRRHTVSAASNVDGLLAELGMTVREGDLVRPALDAPLAAGMTIHLAKARTVHVTLNGSETSLYTQAETVGDILALLGVDPGPDDVLSPSREAVVFTGMDVVIGTTEVVRKEEAEQIPPPPCSKKTRPWLAAKSAS